METNIPNSSLLYEIAEEIRNDWTNINPDAEEYLDAMASLNRINNSYELDRARKIIGHFLLNARAYRGKIARGIKKELNAFLKDPKWVEAGKKAAKTLKRRKAQEKGKWRNAQKKADATYRNSKIFTKWHLSRKGYKAITFESRKGHEYKGIVDLVAIKRNNKKPDELEIIFYQMKGGSARITLKEIERLKQAVNVAKIKISWGVAIKKAKHVDFYDESNINEFLNESAKRARSLANVRYKK